MSRLTRRVLPLLLALSTTAASARAWPVETVVAIGRDARKLLPRSLAVLVATHETELGRETRRLPAALAQALQQDAAAGTLRPQTLAQIDAEAVAVVQLFRERRVSEGLARLGALQRVAAELSDPLLAVGAEGWPPGLPREYYALFQANFEKMPVVVDDPSALALTRPQLGALWESLVARSHQQLPTIRGELVRDGRVLSHRALDFRSPAWAMASLAYSRAVTATAASWLAVWREAHGDTTRMRAPREVLPAEPAAGAQGEPAKPPPTRPAGTYSVIRDPRSIQPEAR